MNGASRAPLFCAVIPCFNHGLPLVAVVDRLVAQGLPCLVVDDGSDADTQHHLDAIAARHADDVIVMRMPVNGGKGAAVLAGLRLALEHGYTHALQVDADGQHQLADVPAFLETSRREPLALVSGRPVFDASIPPARLHGRKITNVLARIEGLSWGLADAMCGFRVYPLQSTLQVAADMHVGKRMDFDTDIMVRMARRRVPTIFLPTRVIYPENGTSQFRMVHDNLRLTWMHVRLLAGVPVALLRRAFGHQRDHWARRPELHGAAGMHVMIAIYRVLGRRAFGLALYPVVAVYWLLAARGRRASRQWLRRVRDHAATLGVPLPWGLNSFRHFMHFGHTIIDRVAAWRGDLTLGDGMYLAGDARQLLLDAKTPAGRLLITAHLGNIEACRALADLATDRTVTALMFTDNARHYNEVINHYSPQARVHVMSVRHVGPDMAIILQQKLDAGEWVAIVGDRIPVDLAGRNRHKIIWSDFMGRPAPFAAGPFILAGTLQCEASLLFAIKQGRKLAIHCEPFECPCLKPRERRDTALQEAVDRYARRLEHFALMAPLEWFNFHDFWRLPEDEGNGVDGEQP